MPLDEKGREVNEDPPMVKNIKSLRKDPVDVIRKQILREMVSFQQEQLVESEEDLNDFDVYDPNDLGDEPLTPYEMVEMEIPTEGEVKIESTYGYEDSVNDVHNVSEEDSGGSDRQSESRMGRSDDGNNGYDNEPPGRIQVDEK